MNYKSLPIRSLFSLWLFFLLPLTVLADDTYVESVFSDYNILKGEWLRTDGNYRIRVNTIGVDNKVSVEYFNPKSIHIAEAAVSTQKGLLKLDIKFQDRGYEGSTYRLYYYAQKDALVGFYYQATTNRTYEVIFLRKV
ncbi:MAG: hypothetical protein ABFR31_02840 [Thermodesulfobacteriota bacterium]